MATADSASLGPRYAPEDPTLPKPWIGLIDGSTGLLYYWNPETNVTKYERPVALPPPLPPGPPPAVTPKLAPIPVARIVQSNDISVQQGQQTGLQQGQQTGRQQTGLQQGQQTGLQQGQQTGAQQGQQVGFQQGQQIGLQQGHQIGSRQGLQAGPQQGQQIGLQQGQQIGPLQGQQIGLQLGQHGPQQGPQIGVSSSHLQHTGASPDTSPQVDSHQIQQMGLQQGQRIGFQQGQIGFQQGQQIGFSSSSYLQPPGVASVASQQVGPHSVQVQQMSPHAQQGHQTGFQQAQQFGLSSHLQQAGVSSVNNQQAGAHPVQVQQMSPHAVHSQQTPSSSVNVHQSGIDAINPHHSHTQQVVDAPINRQHKSGFDSIYPHYPAPTTQQGIDASVHQQQKSGFDSIRPHHINMQQNFDASINKQQISGPMVQMGPQMVHNQQAGGPPMGFKMNHEEDQHGRSGNELYSSGHKEGCTVMAQHPKLAAIPLARNQQGMRMDGIHAQNTVHGHDSGPNPAAGHAMLNMYGRGPGGPAFSNNIPVRPPPRIHGSSDFTNVSVVDAYRQQHEVTATGENVPAPFITFEATGFPPEILREIQNAGFSSPTPIQAQTWPIALQSRDIVAIAKTGSGKTLGYLLPAFIHLRRCRNNPQSGPTVLVLAPTRELATQIQDEAIKFGRSSRFSCTCLYGGAPKGPQLREIERGADIIVATPGRLNDILEMRKINFRQVSFLVLDEADRMLDMGFEPQIRKIVAEIPPNRQTLMYTATWPKEVRKIAGDLLVNPVQVNIGSVDELAANKAITQYVEVVPQMEKQRRLEQILRSQEQGSKVIIFCSTKRLCDQLARSIGRNFGAAAIHGDKSQGERDWVLNQFRSGKSPILVATDVAARGLDIKDIRVVINYDFPTGIEDYVHRIGRTGRAGATGVSYTFFSDQDWKYAADLVKVLEGANQRVPPEVRDMATRGAGFSKGRGGISRWDSGGRGGRDALNGRGGRDGFTSRGGGRGDFFGGRGNRGRGFGGPGVPGSWGRHGRGPHDRHDGLNGRGRYDGRRGGGDRSRGRSYSRSPERVRTWDYDRSRSRSRSRSSRSRSRSRSWSRSRSRSRSYDRFDRSPGRNNLPPLARPRSPYPVRPPYVHRPMAPGFATAPTPQALVGDPAGPEPSSSFERPEGPSPSAGATVESGATETSLNPVGAL